MEFIEMMRKVKDGKCKSHIKAGNLVFPCHIYEARRVILFLEEDRLYRESIDLWNQWKKERAAGGEKSPAKWRESRESQ